MSNLPLKKLALIMLLSSTFGLTACQKTSENEQQNADISADDQIMQELNADPVKVFAKTPDDKYDIQALTDFDTRFTAVSDDMEDELMRMKDEGSLTAEFALQRKQDNIQSALTMLKALDLKTEQGRYIQGLMYQYWDNQANMLKQQPTDKASEGVPQNESIKGLGQFIHAQEQLGHWQEQYPELKHPAQAQ